MSVAKVVEHSEAVSVAAKAGKFKIASQKTEVRVAQLAGSLSRRRRVRVARPHDFHPGQGSTAPLGARVAGFSSAAPRGSDSPVGVQSLVPGQGSTAPRGADLRLVPGVSASASWRASGVDGGAPLVASGCTFAHSRAELHPEGSAHEHELASYFDA